MPGNARDDGKLTPNLSQGPVFDYFDHDADIGIIGHGENLELAFEAAAASMFAVMVDPNRVNPTMSVAVAFDESDVELALVRWLNGLLAVSRSSGLSLASFELRRSGDHWEGQAWGEPWRDEHERGVEVKGATLTMLSVRQEPEGWSARCVVDV